MKRYKILLTIFQIQDFGGITADLELKCRGLKEAGHTVHLVLLRPGDSNPSIRRTNLEGGPAGSYPSAFGKYQGKQILANALQGWYNIPTFSYGTKERMREWQKFANQYDYVFHEIPGPLEPDAKWFWLGIYDIDPKQIVCAHDAHYREMYPHLVHLEGRVAGISCTNPAGYVGLSWIPIPRAFIGAPHPVLDWDEQPDWSDRRKVGVAAHVWKAWKNNDKIVRAVPFLQRSRMLMAGDGIERRYMTSETKCPKQYVGLWDAAVSSGRMKYVGMLPPSKLFPIYQQSRAMIDLSYSKKFANLGNHFNRSIIEGANNGVVSLCVKENMDETGMQVAMFKAGVTHFEVDADDSPEYIAEMIDYVANLPEKTAHRMVRATRDVLLKFFDYRVSSLQFIDLADGKPAGVYPVLETGESNPGVLRAAKLKMNGAPSPTVKAAITSYVRGLDGNRS